MDHNSKTVQWIGIHQMAKISLGFGAIFLVLFASVHTLNAQESELQEELTPHQVKITPKSTLNKEQVKELLADTEYISSTLASEVILGDQTITDFITKGKGESLDGLDTEFKQQRGVLLQNLLETTKLSKTEKEKLKEQYKEKDIQKAAKDNITQTAKVKDVQVLFQDKDKAEKFKQKGEKKSYVKEVKIQEKEFKESEKNEPVEESSESSKNTKQSWLQNLQSSLLSLLQPIQIALASTPAWVPDFVSIAFFDTDEIGVDVYQPWQDIANSNINGFVGFTNFDATSHWWRTYLINQKQDGPYIGKYLDEEGTNFSGWTKMEYPDATYHSAHKLTSHNNELYHSAFDNRTSTIYIRKSLDGGDTWSEFMSVGSFGNRGKRYDLVSHNGQLCMSRRGTSDNIYVACTVDGWNDWTGATWYQAGTFKTNATPSLASAFGSLWIAYRDTTETNAYLASSYDNGQTWNASAIINNDGKGNARISIAGVGSPQWQNEKLCVLRTAGSFTWTNEIDQSCLYRFGPEYDQWNWHPWQKQQARTFEQPIIVSDGTRITQVYQTHTYELRSRTLEWQNPGGRGFISHIKWDGNPGLASNEGVEVGVFMDNSVDNYLAKNTTEESDVFWGFSDCFPIINYGASNLPNVYLDTRFVPNGCDSTLATSPATSYSIGTTDGHLIDSDLYYFTYWNDDKGPGWNPHQYLQIKQTYHTCSPPPNTEFWHFDEWGYDAIKPDTSVWCMWSAGTLYIPTKNQGVFTSSQGVNYQFEDNFDRSWTHPYFYYESNY